MLARLLSPLYLPLNSSHFLFYFLFIILDFKKSYLLNHKNLKLNFNLDKKNGENEEDIEKVEKEQAVAQSRRWI